MEGGIKKKELVTIGDLHAYLSNSNDHSQEADFLCQARIVNIFQQNGWSYVSCTGCRRKFQSVVPLYAATDVFHPMSLESKTHPCPTERSKLLMIITT
ncbi:unnamed protein product [Brassica rapa subsp. trilocularis]